MIFLSFLNDLKIQKGWREVNGIGLKNWLETKKCPMGEYPKGQAENLYNLYGDN